MSKLIFEPERAIYTTNLEILVSHLNYGNHLGYDAVLSILQDARMRWLREHKMTELSLHGSVGYVISEAFINYKAEGFFGDLLEVSLYGEKLGRKTFCLRYQVTNITTGQTLALAETSHVGFDFDRRAITSLPEPFVRILYHPGPSNEPSL